MTRSKRSLERKIEELASNSTGVKYEPPDLTKEEKQKLGKIFEIDDVWADQPASDRFLELLEEVGEDDGEVDTFREALDQAVELA